MHNIYLEVEDEILSARITELFNPVQIMVDVEFNNGYSNIFFVDLETGNWVEQDMGFTKLAKIVGNELKFIIESSSFAKCRMKWKKTLFDDEMYHFGYYKYPQADGTYAYEIFANNKRYMFSLVKKKRSVWQIFKLQGGEGWAYNQKYEEMVPFLLQAGNL